MSDQFEEARAYAAPLLAHLRELGIDELSHYHLAEIDSLDGNYGNAAEHMKIVRRRRQRDAARRPHSRELRSPVRPPCSAALGRVRRGVGLSPMQGRELGLHDDALTQKLLARSWRRSFKRSRGEPRRG